MKTIQEKYNAVLEGKFSKTQFVRDAKRELSQFLSPYNGFEDSVKILKGKGMLIEAKKEEASLEYECPVSEYSDEDLRRGIDYELEQAGLDSTDTIPAEEKEKAEKAAIKNLEKDRMHYLNILAGESAKVDKHDQMVEPNEKNKVDTFNGMKKAELKEEAGVPTVFDDKSMDALRDIILKYVEDPDDAEKAVQKVDDHGLDSLAPELLANLDRDQEYKAWYKDLHGMAESNQEESIANFIIQHYSNPKTGKSLIDDEIISDFFKTHPESRDQEPQDALDNFEEYLSVNYELPGDYMQEGQDDMHAIGLGYLKGFGRKHSLTDHDLKVLGQKVVDSLYKGDVAAAKAKFVGEQMSDEEMEDIKSYGQEEKPTKTYQPGDKWSNDFDYDGMLKAGLKIKISTPLAKMQQIYDSFEDVNYHRENGHLGNAIDYVQDGDKSGALDHLKLFRQAVRKTLSDISEGKCNTHREKNEEVVNESRGAFDMCVSAIQDIAEDGDISEREAAMEMMIAIADKYDFDIAGLESQLFHGDDEEELSDEDRLYNAWEEYKDGDITKDEWDEIRDMYDDDNEWSDDGLNEGRRRKSQGGKVVTENDYDTGGYVEAMGPIFEKAVNMLINAWEEWKMGPMTEPGMIEFAKKDVLDYLETQLMVQNLEEKKGKDHDGDGDIDSDDYMAAKDKAIKKAMKENVKAIITKVLEEQVLNEAATNALAEFSETYGDFEGMKQAIIALQDIVTDIESYYDKTRGKIQKVYDTLGEIRNEEGLKVGGFLAPSIEQAFKKDLRPAISGGFTKGLNQPKVRMITQKDIDMHNSGERPLGEEEKQTVYSRPSVNGALQEKKK